MISRAVKWIGAGVGASGILATVLILLVVFDHGKNHVSLIQESRSPDGKVVAALNQVVTPAHGGPHFVEVTLASHEQSPVVYMQNFECDSDHKAFRLDWISTDCLHGTHGTCDSGRWRAEADNKITKSEPAWQDVEISYNDGGYVAHSRQ
jgi:hypothetical protein